jgi:hypothetical protein
MGAGCSDKSITATPVRHIAITGGTAKSCKKIKLLLKNSRYYYLVDCYKNIDGMLSNESCYLPDCVILDIRSLYSFYAAEARAEKLKEAFPGIKIILYYNMPRRCPLLVQKYRQYTEVYAGEDEQDQLNKIELV